MNLAHFEKDAFQLELRGNIERLLTDSTVSSDQLAEFMAYFQSGRPLSQDTTVNLEDPTFTNALKVVMAYATLAISLQDNAPFDAALEIFPVAMVSATWAPLFIDLVDHIRDAPSSPMREFFTSNQPEHEIDSRIERLRHVLTARFAETL
jgi:hypothetical protein